MPPYTCPAHHLFVNSSFFLCQRMFTGWFDRLIDETDQMPTTCIYISDLFSDTTSNSGCAIVATIKICIHPKESVIYKTQVSPENYRNRNELRFSFRIFSVNLIREPRACVELLHAHCDIHLTLHVIDINVMHVLRQFYLHENGKYRI